MHGHVRLMVGLLLLKQMYDQSDEDVVDRWVENPYWQQFSAVGDFESKLPEQSDSALVYIRCGHKKRNTETEEEPIGTQQNVQQLIPTRFVY